METHCLDNIWRFKPDPGNTGLSDRWFDPLHDFEAESIEMDVPSCWEEALEDYEGVGWYATSVHVSADKAEHIGRLCFEAANYRTTVWVNGQSVGVHEGGYTPFEFQIQKFLQYGEDNHIVVRIISPIITKDIRVDDLGPNDMPHWRGGLTAGIWQSVSLQFNKVAWISSAFYMPKLAHSGFDLDLTIESSESAVAGISIELKDASGHLVFSFGEETALQAGSNSFKKLIELNNPVLWECKNPHLYTAHVSVSFNGETIAQSVERIGLREFTYENERFYLNGKRIYLRGGFWEGVYAKHQSYPENRDVIRKEIKLAKEAGLNLLRPWRRPVPPMILEEADAAGLLIIASPAVECMSCWPTITPEMPTRVEDEIRQLVLRDRNHPSIIWWEMFNEVTRKEIADLIPKMSIMARELDPTRLVLDESGGWADGAHFYLPYSTEKKSLSELHSYVRAPVSDHNWSLYQDLGKIDIVEGNTEIKKGGGIFMSEFGFGGLPEFEENCRLFAEHGNPKTPAYRHHHKLLKDLKAAMTTCGLDKIYPDVDSFCRDSQSVQARGNLRQAEALLSNPNVSGYCMHAFTDGDWILGAGIIDHWQRPKAVYHAITAANQIPRVLCFPERRNLRHGDSVSCSIVLRGENAPVPASFVMKNDTAQLELSHLKWIGKTNFLQLSIELPHHLFKSGQNTIQLTACDEQGNALSNAEIELFVTPEIVVVQGQALIVYDPENLLIPWLSSLHYAFTALEDWRPDSRPTTFLFVPDDVTSKAELPLVAAALEQVKTGHGSAIFLQPPASHENPGMLKNYEANGAKKREENLLFTSGIFPWKLTCQPSFALWESAMHVAKEHPAFMGLPTGCVMDEPYHEVAPVESFYQLEAQEAPAQTITWFRPEVVETKAQKRTYLGGEDLWHGTDLAVKKHGDGNIILSTLILRRKIGKDPVAELIVSNLLAHAETLVKNIPIDTSVKDVSKSVRVASR